MPKKNCFQSKVLNEFSKTVIQARLEKNYTQFDLAEVVDCHLNTISSVERRLKEPCLETIVKLCIGLEISFDAVVKKAKEQITVMLGEQM